MKRCPFCFSAGRIDNIRSAHNIVMFAIACVNDKCLAVGLRVTETEAQKKWNACNLNISVHEQA